MWGSLARAAEPVEVMEPSADLVIRSAQPIDAPCRVVLDRQRRITTPARDVGDYLRAVPGMHLSRRMGHGGPWLSTYRGHDGGYGGAVAVSLEGVPLNEPAHLLQPGLVNLSAIPRHLLQSLSFCPGPSSADTGAFAVAGSAQLSLAKPEEGFRFRLGGGSDGSGEASLAWRPRGFDDGTFVVAEVDGGEGAGQDRSWRHLRAAAGIEGNLGPVSARAFLLLYDGTNEVPIALKAPEIKAGDTNFFGGDLVWRGRHVHRRLLLGVRLARPWQWGGVRVVGWIGSQGFRNRDNQTGYLHTLRAGESAATASDGYEQRQSTFQIGLRGQVQRVFSFARDRTELSTGIDLQARFLRQRRWDATPESELATQLLERRIEHGVVALWTEARMGLFGRGQLTASLRVEQTDIGVRLLEPGDGARAAGQVGGNAAVILPRISGGVALSPGTWLYSSFSRGFRPPDARFVDRDGRLLGSRYDTGTAGLQAELGAVDLQLAGFGTWSPGERITDQLDGRLLGFGSTRRTGVEGALSVSLRRKLRLAGDLSWTDARYIVSKDRLPYVPAWQASIGLYSERTTLGPVVLLGGIRAWYVGPRPLPGGFRSRLSIGVDITARVLYRKVFFEAAIDNAVPWRWRQAEYVYASHWDRDAEGLSLVPERHVVPSPPAAIRIGFGGSFR